MAHVFSVLELVLFLLACRVHGDFNYYTPGNYTHSVTSLLNQCKTASQVCSSSVLSTLPPENTYTTTVSVARTTTTKTIKYKATRYITNTITRTIPETVPQETITKGRKTVTVNKCATLSTCGPATFTSRNELQDACYILLQKNTRDTVTSTTATSFQTSYVYRATKVATTTVETVMKVTPPVLTKTIATTTVHRCKTLPAPQPTCDNFGFQWAIFTITAADFNGGTGLNNWDPTVYKTRTPNNNGTGTFLGGIRVEGTDDYYEDVFGQAYYEQYRTVHHKGYLYTPQTGTYKFRIPSVIEKGYLWVGDVAYAGWKTSNAAVCQDFDQPCTTCSNGRCDGVAVSLVAGKYYPYRLVFGGEFGGNRDVAKFYVNFQRPDGLIFEGSYAYKYFDHYYPDLVDYYLHDPHYLHPHEDSAYLLKRSCDGTSGPPFADWGEET